MKKIYKLKKWYSLSDAANRLTQTLGETVELPDVLELAIEGHLQLHWFMRHVPAFEVEFTRKKIPKFKSKYSDQSDKEEFFLVDGFFQVESNSKVSYLNGAHIIHLKLCGALSDYLRSHLTCTGGELISIDGFYVEDKEGKIWNIAERFDKAHLKKWKTDEDHDLRDYYSSDNYFPSGEWPQLSELGFTKNELEKFENKLNDQTVTEIKPKERATLLKIVSGMAKDGYGYDPTASRSPFPKELEGILDSLGMPVSDDTIRKWLKEASEYLPQNNDAD